MSQRHVFSFICFVSNLLVPFMQSSAWAGTIKGKLKGNAPSSYKVVAVAKDSRSTVANVSASGAFRISAKRGTTLQLVSTTGRYFGPIVAAKGSKAYATLTGTGGNLGSIAVMSGGFGTVKYGMKNKKIFSNKPSIFYNKSTGPRGAGKFGLVSAAVTSAQKDIGTLASELGEDGDKDGLPDLLDLDDDGDLLLDVNDEVTHQDADFSAASFSTLRLDLVSSLDPSASGSTDSILDDFVKNNLILALFVRNHTGGAQTLSAVNIDCQSLNYCKSGSGTATIRMDNGPLAEGATWVTYDPDGDSLPNLQLTNSSERAAEIGIRPRATRSELRPGDTVFFKLATSTGNLTIPGIIPFYFVTAPTVTQYTDAAGVSGTIIYPVSEGGAGTDSNPIQLQGTNLSLTFRRPVRQNVEGAEAAGLIEMGGLQYGIEMSVQGSETGYRCATSEYSGLSSTLSAISGGSSAQILKDSGSDAPTSASGGMLSFTVAVGTCLERQGYIHAGKRVTVQLVATSEQNDQTSQSVTFRMP